MLAKISLLTLLVAATCASPVAPNVDTANYGEAVSMFLQAWKKMLPCGYAADKIPAMAPLTKEFVAINYNRGETSIKGNVSNLYITGFNDFQVLSGSYDANTQRSTFDMLYPEIQILGSYIAEGTINILGFTFPLLQKSLLNERIEQLRLVGEYTFATSLTNPNGLRISDFNLQFYLGDVKIDNWDTLWNISSNNFSNAMSANLLTFIAQQIQPIVDQLFAEHLLPQLNEGLSHFNLTELTNLFVSLTKAWNTANCTVQA